MKNTIRSLIVFSVLGFTNLSLAQQPFGLGLVIGDPTGVTAKYWLSQSTAVDGTVGLSSSHIHFHINHVWHKFGIFDIDKKPIDLYYGVGARMKDWERETGPNRSNSSGVYFGARAPVGLRHQFRDPSIEAFVELALGVDLIPRTGVGLDFGLGARYFF